MIDETEEMEKDAFFVSGYSPGELAYAVRHYLRQGYVCAGGPFKWEEDGTRELLQLIVRRQHAP